MDDYDELTIDGKETIASVVKSLLAKCKESPLGTSLVQTLERMVVALVDCKPIGGFAMEDIFKLQERKVGSPNSCFFAQLVDA